MPSNTDKLFYIGVKGLIQNDAGDILLLYTGARAKLKVIKDPYWDLPGGRIQQGQNILEALEQEIIEETGIQSFHNPELISAVISNHISKMDDGRELGLTLLIYRIQITEEADIILSDEHESFEWCDKKIAAQRLLHKYPKEFTDQL